MSRHDKPAPEVEPTEPAGDGPGEQQVTGLAEYNAEVLNSQPGLREAFLMMLAEVPDPSDDAAARIVGTILQAETAEELDRPWDSDGLRKHFDEIITVHEISKRPSDYTGGLGVYLGCECTMHSSGEQHFLTCGSVSAVAQLVRAHTIGVLPLTIIPRNAKKPTRDGYWPYHLEVVQRLAGS